MPRCGRRTSRSLTSSKTAFRPVTSRTRSRSSSSVRHRRSSILATTPTSAPIARHRHRAGSQSQRQPLLLPHRPRCPAGARPGEPRHGAGHHRGPDPGDRAGARQARSHGRHRLSRRARRRGIPAGDDELYLVGTSEVALAGYHADEILDAESLPRRYAGFSSCFRREAGSYGKDTRGIIRVHWFDKVEMFSYTTGRTPATNTSGCWLGNGNSSTSWNWPIGSSTSPPGISARAPPASSTSRRGSRRRVPTAN